VSVPLGPAGINHWTSGRQTNARVEGFNLKAKLVKRRAYGTALLDNRSLGNQLQTQTRCVSRKPHACGG